MDGIQLMIDEHVDIKRMLKVVRNASYGVLKGENINYDDFEKMIDFIRNFADDHHHAKEEKFLFNRMTENLGQLAEKVITNGMLVEHSFGRMYVMNLEEALEKVKNGDDFAKIDVIANAVGYTNLLDKHIDKEDDAVYTFAKNQLDASILKTIDEECEAYEKEKFNEGTQKKYLNILTELEKKYCE